MANRFIGGVLTSKQPNTSGFVSRASTGTYFNNQGLLTTAPVNQPRLNYSFNGVPASNYYSAYFNGSAYLTATMTAFGTNAFTTECWFNLNSIPTAGQTYFMFIDTRSTDTNGSVVYVNSSGVLYFGSGSNYSISTGQTLVINRWYHVAVTRASGTTTCWLNGASVGTTSDSSNLTSTQIRIGTNYTAGYNFNTGYISNVRIVSGVAVYTGAFTVPTSPLTATQSSGTNISAITGTQTTLLTCQNNAFTDFSANALTVTNTSVSASIFLPLIYTPDLTSGTGWYNPTVLIEPSATNLIQYSTAYTNAFWTPFNNSGAILTVTANTAIAPDGTLTASSITGSSTSGFKVIGPGAVTSWLSVSGVYTYSFFVKAGPGANYVTTWAGGAAAPAGIDFATYNLINGTLLASSMGTGSSTNIFNVGNGWWRVTWTSTYNSSNSSSPIIGLADANTTSRAAATPSTGTLYIWGSQFETGPTATSYIPTNGSTVTRSQDDAGPTASGVYKLLDLQQQSSIDDQSTVQSYTSVGTSYWTCPTDVTSVEVLVVAGGGGGGAHNSSDKGGGGGGAGGLIYNTSYPVVPGTTYPIVIGAGGAGATAGSSSNGSNGLNSQFGSLVAVGGGGGGAGYGGGPYNGASGGSGGGGVPPGAVTGLPGLGIAGQGNSGGTITATNNATGGGGAGGQGGANGSTFGGNGGPGLTLTISGSAVTYAGGGGGGAYSGTSGTGGLGGGGNAGAQGGTSNPGANATGYGSGGGGAGGGSSGTAAGGNGSSGIVVIKYKSTQPKLSAVSNLAVVTQKFSTTISAGWTAPAGVTQVEVLVVAGGGGGSSGGGGAGGLVYNSAYTVTPGSTYTVTVGSGGNGGYCDSGGGAIGTAGGNSVFGTLTAIGGGRGGQATGVSGTTQIGGNGGSGGGASADSGGTDAGGSSTQNSSGSAGYGNSGASNGGFTSSPYGVGGGGGAGSAAPVVISTGAFGGGAGLSFSISGNSEYYAGGGGGGCYTGAATIGQGGIGGGGRGGSGGAGYPGATNTGGGGGGASTSYIGGAGGSGVIIIRYRVPTVAIFQDSGAWTCPAGVTSVQALIVGGGGAGGCNNGGGGGAGGVVYASSIPVTPGVTYPVIVGQGGLPNTSSSAFTSQGGNGQNSSFANVVAYGGGGGGGQGGQGGGGDGKSGGSGGGTGNMNAGGGFVGSGTYGQGNNGGLAASGSYSQAAGGGGAGGPGASFAGGTVAAGNGGPGLPYSISGSSITYGGGGGGASSPGSAGQGSGGSGGGGAGVAGNGVSGTQNTGGGGGGCTNGATSGSGGSGIVIIRYYGG